MFVVKRILGSRGVASGAAPLTLIRSRSRLGQKAIAASIISELEVHLARRRVLRKAVAECVDGIVADEVKFVERQQKPAGKVAAFYADQDERVKSFITFLVELLGSLLSACPEDGGGGKLQFKVTLVTLMRGSQDWLQSYVKGILLRHVDGDHLVLGAALADVTAAGLCRASGLTEAEARLWPRRLKWPQDAALSSREMVSTYLGGTPLARLLLAPVSINIAKRLV